MSCKQVALSVQVPGPAAREGWMSGRLPGHTGVDSGTLRGRLTPATSVAHPQGSPRAQGAHPALTRAPISPGR